MYSQVKEIKYNLSLREQRIVGLFKYLIREFQSGILRFYLAVSLFSNTPTMPNSINIVLSKRKVLTFLNSKATDLKSQKSYKMSSRFPSFFFYTYPFTKLGFLRKK